MPNAVFGFQDYFVRIEYIDRGSNAGPYLVR